MAVQLSFRFQVILVILAVLFVTTVPASAAGVQVGQVVKLEGTASLIHAGAKDPVPAKTGDPVYYRDRIDTTADARLQIALADGSSVSIGPKTVIIINEYVYDPKKKARTTKIRLFFGKVKCFVTKMAGFNTNSFTVETKTATAGVRGTVFLVWAVTETQTVAASFDDVITVHHTGKPDKVVVVAADTFTRVRAGQPLAQAQAMTAAQARQFQAGLLQGGVPPQNLPTLPTVPQIDPNQLLDGKKPAGLPDGLPDIPNKPDLGGFGGFGGGSSGGVGGGGGL